MIVTSFNSPSTILLIVLAAVVLLCVACFIAACFVVVQLRANDKRTINMAEHDQSIKEFMKHETKRKD